MGGGWEGTQGGTEEGGSRKNTNSNIRRVGGVFATRSWSQGDHKTHETSRISPRHAFMRRASHPDHPFATLIQSSLDIPSSVLDPKLIQTASPWIPDSSSKLPSKPLKSYPDSNHQP